MLMTIVSIIVIANIFCCSNTAGVEEAELSLSHSEPARKKEISVLFSCNDDEVFMVLTKQTKYILK